MSGYINTVGDLIRELKKFPSEAYVFDLMYEPIDRVYYKEEIPLGDTGNPKCKWVEGVIIE